MQCPGALPYDRQLRDPALRLRGTKNIRPFGVNDESIDELTRLQVAGDARDAIRARALASAATRGPHCKRESSRVGQASAIERRPTGTK